MDSIATDPPLRLKELMFVKIMDLNETQMTEVFQIAQAMRVDVVDIGVHSVMLECRRTEQKQTEQGAYLTLDPEKTCLQE